MDALVSDTQIEPLARVELRKVSDTSSRCVRGSNCEQVSDTNED
jgi:hypothetical protein